MASTFFQDPPRPPDPFATDAALQAELARRLPAGILARATPILAEMGRHAATTLPPIAEKAEAEPPVHVPYGAFGRRVDEIRVSSAWDALKTFAAEQGIVAIGYDTSFGEHRRLVQCALLHLYSAASATYSCPLAMTDAAARVLIDLAPASLKDRLVPGLLSRDPKTFLTSGQWMTERTGGSDVSNTSTIARPKATRGEERVYTLHGVKWFTSATTSEMALTLARIDDGKTPPVEGSRGLSLFCVEVIREPDAGFRGIQVHRLKDKLGTRALPTAELNLDGVEAVMLGEPGRGVASISGMLNVTRLYNAISSASGMARALGLARDYASRRVAFGKPLAAQPLHAETLAEMEADTAGALALSLEVASLLGRAEHGVATDEEKRRLRGLIPLAKLTTAKQAVALASEALECFGGAGYVEDTGLPRLLRDAQVLSIWEGTTNVLSLDVLRAEAKEGALSAVIADLSRRAETLPRSLPEKPVELARLALGRLHKRLASLASSGSTDAMERDARRISLATGHLAEALLLAETATAGAPGSAERFERFTRSRLAASLE